MKTATIIKFVKRNTYKVVGNQLILLYNETKDFRTKNGKDKLIV